MLRWEIEVNCRRGNDLSRKTKMIVIRTGGDYNIDKVCIYSIFIIICVHMNNIIYMNIRIDSKEINYWHKSLDCRHPKHFNYVQIFEYIHLSAL